MSNGKGGGSAKNGSGKGGGEVVPVAPEASVDQGRNESSPAPEPYNAQRDFYGDGDMVNQPLPGYFKTFPAPGGNNYAPPVVEEPVDPVYRHQPTQPADPVIGGSNNPANRSPEVRNAYAAGATNQASANELAAFNLGVPDTNNDGRLSNDEFTSWDGYGAWSKKNGKSLLHDSRDPGGMDGSRFTGQYGQDGKPVYTSPSPGITAEQLAMLTSGMFGGSGYMGANVPQFGQGQNGFNPAFLPNSSPFSGSLLDPNRL